MKSIKEITDMMNEGSYYDLSSEPKICQCGNKYYDVHLGQDENGKHRLVDPGKCEGCIKKSVKEETDEIVRNTNKELANKRMTTYNPYCVIPPGCEGATFDNYNPENQTQQQALQMAKQFVENVDVNSNHSLMFQGTPGIGKSHLSVSIHKAMREKGIPTLIVDVPSLFQEIKSMFGYSDSSQAQEKIMRKLKDVEVLILDDIGAEYAKSDGNESWASDTLYQIMNDRQTKVNVFSTNYTSKDLKQKYGQLSTRIISRMLAGAEVIKVEGKDQRMKGFE